MRLPKTVLKRLIQTGAVVVVSLSVGCVFYFNFLKTLVHSVSNLPSLDTTALYKREGVKQKVEPGLPVRLEIPKINVNAALDYVGITSQGKLGTPSGPAKAAWYKQGPRPGENGSAVIDGHFGYRNRVPAVFDNLHTLQKGDKLYVQDTEGLIIAFAVRELRTYHPDEYAPEIFRSSDGKAHLNLITCQGEWDKTQNGFSNRLVVFADEEE